MAKLIHELACIIDHHWEAWRARKQFKVAGSAGESFLSALQTFQVPLFMIMMFDAAALLGWFYY